jgi:hypothetical protein
MTVSQSALLFGLTIATFFNVVYFYNDIKGFIVKYKERRAGISGPNAEGEV